MKNYLKITLKDFKFMLSNKEFDVDIICNDHVDELQNKILYIKFILALKIKPMNIKDIYEEIKEKINEQKSIDMIIVLKSKPNNSILKLQKIKHMEIFKYTKRLRLM